MSAVPSMAVAVQTGGIPQPIGADGAAAIPLSAFLDHVAGLLRALPDRVWIEATVLDVRASAAGHTLELTDPTLERGRGTLRVFLSTGTLSVIRRDLGVPVDPVLLAGMSGSRVGSEHDGSPSSPSPIRCSICTSPDSETPSMNLV